MPAVEPRRRPGRRAAAVQPVKPYTLQIPRGERRPAPRKRTARRAIRAFAALAIVSIPVLAGAIAWSMDTSRATTVMSQMTMRATAAAIALGFGIDQVNLTGHRYTADNDVYDALDLANVRGFWELDSAAVLKRIERIAWVDTAQITRVYPGRLDIEIRERSPAALWTRGDAQYLIDASGRVLGPAARAQDWRLPRVAGEGANIDAALLLLALTRHPLIADRVTQSERVAERRWRLILKNGAQIELAAEREIEGLDQIAGASTLMKSISGDPVVIDVRTQGRIAVRPLSGSVGPVATNAARQP